MNMAESESQNDIPLVSQSENKIFHQLQIKLGKLTPVEFQKELVRLVGSDIEHLHHIRDALYDLCQHDFPETTRGQLLTHKNTKGGTAAEKKLLVTYRVCFSIWKEIIVWTLLSCLLRSHENHGNNRAQCLR